MKKESLEAVSIKSNKGSYITQLKKIIQLTIFMELLQVHIYLTVYLEEYNIFCSHSGL